MGVKVVHDASAPTDDGVRLPTVVTRTHAMMIIGVVVQVDPAYTSQTCHACGHVDKRNRRSQAAFHCGRCDLVGHADHNAALNIAARGVQRWGEVMRPDAAPILAAS